MTSRRIIVLGATSAIGEATSRLYAAEGARILLVGRRTDHLSEIAADLKARGAATVDHETQDLARPADAESQLAAMAARLGGVDDILIFYGALGDQKRDERDLSSARDILAVNFTSAAEWCLAAANLLESQGKGSLVVVGSVAGDRGRQSNFIYGAAKAGLGVLVEGIAHRMALQGRGVRAVLVKPGFVDTPMTADIKKGGPLWATPEQIATIVRAAADKGGPIVYAPWFWRYILLIVRNVPASIFHKLKL
jgi:NAD(P)-dependent dehydrogenase (short-subunit alcohol dehydrogenase family)